MKRMAALMLLVGLALFTAMLAWQGAGALARAVAAVGWGLVAVTAWHLVPLVIDSHAWRLLFDRPRPPILHIVWARWIGESINGLLPVAQIGGDIAKARLLIKRGLAGAETGASVVVDTTLAAIGQMLFAIAGLLMLLALMSRPDLAWALGIGIAAMLAILATFYRLQRGGMFGVLAGFVHRVGGGRAGLDFVGGAKALDVAIAAIYARPGVVLRGLAWRLVGWFVGTGEVWLALYFLGHPVGVDDALMIEALGQAIRGAAFVIPGALGVQEGGFALLATLVGLDAETGVALSLVKRVRELSLGLPGLVAWQIAEGRIVSGRARRIRGEKPRSSIRQT
ncbi:lysylphosphatidylglycerol synthase domain-containing protein [Salinisphaera sp. Q1T1-3]|uniref:lysylphosphatidylglycerol synthase domain-containing protein n=1 Tax=Salinisphaera sp. Q1T1-3 TaxID=2321229 RepID=UPI000E74144C|nr:lysylphosphatidylglycerol synthase domain-containing protein [Salinisphaera sp. Q1T1-3]RJS93963.1 TIGR00374 family protein [Salinisphaera sp. Q1T1-3]